MPDHQHDRAREIASRQLGHGHSSPRAPDWRTPPDPSVPQITQERAVAIQAECQPRSHRPSSRMQRVVVMVAGGQGIGRAIPCVQIGRTGLAVIEAGCDATFLKMAALTPSAKPVTIALTKTSSPELQQRLQVSRPLPGMVPRTGLPTAGASRRARPFAQRRRRARRADRDRSDRRGLAGPRPGTPIRLASSITT